MRRLLLMFTASLLLMGCPGKDKKPGTDAGAGKTAKPSPDAARGPDEVTPGEKKIQPPLPAAPAPSESQRLAAVPRAEEMVGKIKSYYQTTVGRRLHVQVDKPLYQPGESIWIRTWDLSIRDLSGTGQTTGLLYELVSPKGATVLRKRVQQDAGIGQNDFVIPEGVQGGEYIVRVTSDSGVKEERPVIVQTYEPPRIKKTLEFLRKAYGAGDEVTATVEVKRPTGEPLAKKALEALIRLDGQDLPRVQVTTNEHGGALVRFKLPGTIELGDGLLTVLVDESGVTESISKSIPIVMKKLQLSFFPEGGQLVSGLPGRVYFEAKTLIGKPADVEGKIVDDHGNAVARFKSYHHGMGRFDLTPATGRSYKAVVEKPVGISEQVGLPLPQDEGCVLMSYDDFDGQADALRASVRCSKPMSVTVVGMMRENLLDAATVQVPEGEPAVVYLRSQDPVLAKAQGTARVTVFDEERRPLCERLVYRNRRALLGVKVEPHKKGYIPREQVTLAITTTDPSGKPVPAEVALSVVDDTVVSFADDKTGHMLSRLYLEQELPDKVEEPKIYFDLTEKKSAMALDMLVGTRGWRRFAWEPIWNPPVQELATTGAGGGGLGRVLRRLMGNEELEEGKGQGFGRRPERRRAEAKAEGPRPAMAAPRGAPVPVEEAAPMAQAAAEPPPPPAQPPAKPVLLGARARNLVDDALMPADRPARQDEAQRENIDGIAKDKEWAEASKAKKPDVAGEVMADDDVSGWAAVRVFPAPTYSGEYTGPRTDFRETIHWAPRVATGKDGTATVNFYLSDAVTSFRVFTEGAAGGFLGRDETVFKSSLPFSMSIKLPLEVSAGDRLKLPLTLTNETDKPLDVAVKASFGELLTVEDAVPERTFKLAARKGESLVYAVQVTGKQGKSQVQIAASAGSLKDEFTREVVVVPVGFPQEIALSGEVSDRAVHEVDLGDAVPGSVDASVRFYPSPVSSMLSGLDGMLRQPTGCFEQASSSNYPNVMIMRYLKEQEVTDAALIERSQKLLDEGYMKLAGYESPQKGYEWFGGNPGHEALTAYGILQFMDMKEIYGGVSEPMIQRTAAWLKSRRDGKGGFERNARALDSFGSASPEVTNAYIIYSLTEAGYFELEAEIDGQAKLAENTKDAYLLALSANTLLNVPRTRALGEAAARKLAAMQESDGSFKRADHSITRSGGQNLMIETTALAVMALIKAGGQEGKVREGITWMNENRGGYGQWGATQATVLGLKALLLYTRASRQMQNDGTVTVRLGGVELATLAFEAGRRDPIVFENLGTRFAAGKNTLEVLHQGKGALPYSIAVTFRSKKPATSDKSVVDLATTLEKSQVKMGETVRLNAVVKNRTAEGQPMTLARVGLPGGLTFQTWQLKELRDKQLIAFYETRPREVILYFRQLKPSEEIKVPIDLVAMVPGEYTAPASSGYLYYTDEFKTWTPPLAFTVTQ